MYWEVGSLLFVGCMQLVSSNLANARSSYLVFSRCARLGLPVIRTYLINRIPNLKLSKWSCPMRTSTVAVSWWDLCIRNWSQYSKGWIACIWKCIYQIIFQVCLRTCCGSNKAANCSVFFFLLFFFFVIWKKHLSLEIGKSYVYQNNVYRIV